MDHILAFFGSECSSEAAKNHCWPLPWEHVHEKPRHVLFHPSILRWLTVMEREHKCSVLVDVLALAHFIDAEFLVEVLGTFFARELLCLALRSTSLLLSEEDADFFQSRLGIAKRLSSLLLTPDLDIHFPSLVDPLALADDVWSNGWHLFEKDVATWADDLRLARMLRQRCRLQQNTPTSASALANVQGISKASVRWNWLKDSITRVGNIHLNAGNTATMLDWAEVIRLVSKNKSISFLSFNFECLCAIPHVAVDLLVGSNTTKLEIDFLKDVWAGSMTDGEHFSTLNDFLLATLPSMAFPCKLQPNNSQ